MRLTFTVQLSDQQVEEIIEGNRERQEVSIAIKSNRVLAPPLRDEKMRPRWLNMRDASRYCGLSVATLTRVVKEGHVISHIRGRRLVDRWSLDEWVQGDSQKRWQKPPRELPRLSEVDVQSIAEAVASLLNGPKSEPNSERP